VSITLLANLPELGTLSRHQIGTSFLPQLSRTLDPIPWIAVNQFIKGYEVMERVEIQMIHPHGYEAAKRNNHSC
jgi:hypothetical protein